MFELSRKVILGMYATGSLAIAAFAIEPTSAQTALESLSKSNADKGGKTGGNSLVAEDPALPKAALQSEAENTDLEPEYTALLDNPSTERTPAKGNVTAAYTRTNGWAMYLFYADGTYGKTSGRDSIGFDPGYPRSVPLGWINMPKDWIASIDAALPLNGSKRGYMWNGSGGYIRLSDTTLDKGYPAKMPGGWQNMPAGWENIDAGVHFHDSNRQYMFKDHQYIRLTGVKVDAGYPATLPGGWIGMPGEFHSGIDAATYNKGHTYMIKGDQYIRFTGTRVDAGYPKPMSQWPQ